MMNYRPISKQDYSIILELDKKVYPTKNPVSPNILEQWFQHNPEFGMIFDDQGLCVAIPLNEQAWLKLISGKLSEAELDSQSLFDNSRDQELGIHIYHIEKTTESKFHETCFKALGKIVNDLRIKNPALKLIGLSAYCVTQAGIKLFADKLSFSEKAFISTEYILEKNSELNVFNANSQQALTDKIIAGYQQINRCKMLVSYPDEQHAVWMYFNNDDQKV